MKNKISVRLLFTVFLGLIINTAIAQPSNNECSGAILVTTSLYSDEGGTYTNVNTSGATASVPNPACITSNDNNDDVWYKFVAQTQTELLRVHSAVSGSSYVTFGYALYDGCGGTEMVCNNEMGTFHGNEMLGGLTVGNTYYLRFWSKYNFTSMSLAFCVQDIYPATPGDNQNTATVLNINAAGSLCIAPQFFTTGSATRSALNPTCNADNDDDVWFKFTCPNHAVNIYPEEGVLITSGDFANLGMEIIDAGTGISQSCVANYGVGSITSFVGVPGAVYFIRIWTMGTTDRAVFSLCLQDGYDVKPSNDTCANAIDLIVGSGVCSTPLIGNLANSTVTSALLGNPSCTVNTTLKNDVWYKATVPSSGNIVVQTSATHSAVDDLVLLAYTNNCTTFTQIACDEDGNTAAWPSANHARISLTARTPGEIIYYRVLPRNGDNLGQFSICAYDETAPVLPSISIADIKKKEGNSGTKNFDFIISLSAASIDTVKVNYKTQDITAIAPGDYTSVHSTQLVFNPGDTEKTISVLVNGDTNIEPNETFKVKLLNPVNAILAVSSGKGTIKDDDGPNASVDVLENKSNTAAAIKIYPNPANDVLHVYIPLSNSKNRITILDMAGRTIKNILLTGNQKEISVPIKDLSHGNYIINVNCNGVNSSFKFVKQ